MLDQENCPGKMRMTTYLENKHAIIINTCQEINLAFETLENEL